MDKDQVDEFIEWASKPGATALADQQRKQQGQVVGELCVLLLHFLVAAESGVKEQAAEKALNLNHWYRAQSEENVYLALTGVAELYLHADMESHGINSMADYLAYIQEQELKAEAANEPAAE